MPGHQYLTEPPVTHKLPAGIPYIVGNEAAERFSYYGMRAILVVFMTQYLLGSDGQPAPMSDSEAKVYYHYFVMAAYFFPLLGALVADVWLGKYRTILWLSIVYCLGHFALAVNEQRIGLMLGLTLIAVGAGGIKPCVSAHVGDQFGTRNQHLIEKVFGWFYFAINLGALASTLLIPSLLQMYGPRVAFGVPGVLMLLATIVFWLGRNKFVHIPPGGPAFARELFSREGLNVIGRLSIIYVFVAVFWSLYDQTGSAWVLQAEKMDRHFLGIEWHAAQVQAINPLLILAYIPLFTYGIYPAISRVFPLTPLRKVSIGLFLTAISFTIPAWIETRLIAGQQPNIVWQLLAFTIITAAEVMVSITCLEFSYTQAPPKLKSLVMSLYMLSVSLGNLFAAQVNEFISKYGAASGLEGAAYYWFFAGVMLATAVLFVLVAATYRGRTYVQGVDPERAEWAEADRST